MRPDLSHRILAQGAQSPDNAPGCIHYMLSSCRLALERARGVLTTGSRVLVLASPFSSPPFLIINGFYVAELSGHKFLFFAALFPAADNPDTYRENHAKSGNVVLV